MGTYESVEIPFMMWGDRQVLSRLQVENHPFIEDFVRRFPYCFDQHEYADFLVFYPEGDSPHPVRLR